MKRREAFTLIELLVVIAIISLLVSILLPSLNRAKGLAKEVLCLTRQKQIGYAFSMYADDNNDYMCGVLADGYDMARQSSTVRSWSHLLSKYVGEPAAHHYEDGDVYGTTENEVFWCPEWTGDRNQNWYTGYGVAAIVVGDFKDVGDMSAIYENTIPAEPGVENAKWFPAGKDCRFYRRNEFYRPEVRGWLTDSVDWHTAGSADDTYEPNPNPRVGKWPYWANDAQAISFAKDPERHGGRCNVLFVNGNARSLGYMVSGHAFWDIDNVPQ